MMPTQSKQLLFPKLNGKNLLATSGRCNKKIPSVIKTVGLEASEVVTASHFHPSPIFVSKAGAYSSGVPDAPDLKLAGPGVAL